MGSKLHKNAYKQQGKKFLVSGVTSYMFVTILAFSGMYSDFLDSIFSNSEGAGMAAAIIVYGFFPLLPAILLGRSYVIFMQKAVDSSDRMNVLLIATCYFWIMVSHFVLGIIVWRYFL